MMNASVQGRVVGIVNKVENISDVFQAQFPSVHVEPCGESAIWSVGASNVFSQDELSQVWERPWANRVGQLRTVNCARKLNVLSLSFRFPKWQPSLSCSHILLRISLSEDLLSPNCTLDRLIMSACDHNGQSWEFSSHNSWQFSGTYIPCDQGQRDIKAVVSQLYRLFGQAVPLY